MNIQKYILTLLFMLLATVQMAAQGLVVKQFYHAERDFTANSGSTIVLDRANREPCALIKVRTMEKGFVFQTSKLLPIVKIEEQTKSHPMEIYVWVQSGVKRLSIGHKKYGTIYDYDLAQHLGSNPLESDETYILELETIEAQPTVKEARTQTDKEGETATQTENLKNGAGTAGAAATTATAKQPKQKEKQSQTEIAKTEKPKSEKPKVEKPKAEKPKTEKPKTVKPKSTTPSKPLMKPTEFYVSIGAQPISLLGLTADVGVYLKNINIEGFYTFGLASETVYWGSTNSTAKFEYKYKPMVFGLRLGYGILLANSRLRITPQAGIAAVSVTGTNNGGNNSPSHANSMSGTIGARVDFALARHIGLYLTPEYGIALSKSSVYKELQADYSKFGKWNSGFNVRLGLRVSF